MKSNETIQKHKREPEVLGPKAPLPPVVSIIGFCWMLVFTWEFFTSSTSEILNVIGVTSMIVMILTVWIARKYKNTHT